MEPMPAAPPVPPRRHFIAPSDNGWRPVPNEPPSPEDIDDRSVPMFRRFTMAELLSEPDDFAWLIQGLLAEPTYGQVAGEMKALKTYLAAMIQVGLAAGVPILDRFTPAAPRPVLAYVGEGGRRPYARRLRRIAHAMGVDLTSIPLHISTDVAPITSDAFSCSIERDLAEVEPALVFIDPYYAYHGSKTKASDLHQEGALLSGLSARCIGAGASLMVVNHLNQTGAGLDLKRITMAGSGEWVDSWLLLAHREPADVEAGEFKLRLEIGSRQWGGTSWDLDLSIGRFDEDNGSHDGDIAWHLERAGKVAGAANDKDADVRQAVLDVLADRVEPMSKTDVFGLVKGNRERFHRVFNDLADKGLIRHDQAGKTPENGSRGRVRWYLPADVDQTAGPQGGDDEKF